MTDQNDKLKKIENRLNNFLKDYKKDLENIDVKNLSKEEIEKMENVLENIDDNGLSINPSKIDFLKEKPKEEIGQDNKNENNSLTNKEDKKKEKRKRNPNRPQLKLNQDNPYEEERKNKEKEDKK